ncbi:HugZ family protein [Paenibacillus alvei]|uniref:HugZ family pyridoxamine 5'-phosphate oxidase n=2 Tax=Paenibacillus TaxID=44249 RepID=UPI002DDD371A|nr:pyridoxamine 5'-phosphate oxidase family protein [Paenibacillus alvei]
MSMKQQDNEKMKRRYMEFIDSVQSVTLSTIAEDGSPFVSYAPYVRMKGKLYIYISKIAQHYRYLEANPRVDIMMIEDESKTNNMFARQRARFACLASKLESVAEDAIFTQFETSFGASMIQMLRGLDFSLFELMPTEGRYVAGFGQAYDIDLEALRFDHVARDGHQQADQISPA